jgi:hypothetical protein
MCGNRGSDSVTSTVVGARRGSGSGISGGFGRYPPITSRIAWYFAVAEPSSAIGAS